MEHSNYIASANDKPLFTPGPLTTSRSVKQAMLRDLGSRDSAFVNLVRDVRQRLLALAGVAAPDYECVIMQGSGTYSVEAVISSAVSAQGKLLAISNGAYGQRIIQIAKVHKIDATILTYPEDAKPTAADVEAALAQDPALTHVALVHSETTTGMINPIDEIGAVVKRHKRRFIVDAMSSFGGMPLEPDKTGIDFLVSSANKCIEGVPGFGLILASRAALLECEGRARSLSLDVFGQWKALEANGQFRFTPPTHALLAFHQALDELVAEGGVIARAQRYSKNYQTLVAGMRSLGFKEYLQPQDQGHIIVSFRFPDHPRFEFEEFYSRLSDKGYVIYPGKVSNADCFRIGCIGRLFPADFAALLAAIRAVKLEMNFEA
ncbi:2-aminoethylphosphonate--pyruvate transaminase [Anaerolineae bacterium]|nr:2-aminoethylphosphonate--pyruvate transaminase [Chloroflexota bacterium]GBL37015.1 2-aminoethylphosphonate--pyruvate transaminase [Anaerolineaceae bacterium]GDX67091.1 2-aminoethylphosphonate--pyruvate transaminase [Anaerolineae bacterium]